jgi:hypothetical protein
MTLLQLVLIFVALILAIIEGSRSQWQSLLVWSVVLLAFALALPHLATLAP